MTLGIEGEIPVSARRRIGAMIGGGENVRAVELASFGLDYDLDEVFGIDRSRFQDDPARMGILYKAIARCYLPEAAKGRHTVIDAKAIRKLTWEIASELVWPGAARSEELVDFVDSMGVKRRLPSDFPRPETASLLVDKMIEDLDMQEANDQPFIGCDKKDTGAFLQDVFVSFEQQLQDNGYELISKGGSNG